MAGRILRGAIVGAATLLGKELADELNSANTAAWDLTLLDVEESGGQIAAAGDETQAIQPISSEAFAGMDVVFFAGDAATALEFWQAARAAGASIVDLTGALEGQPQVLVRSVFIEGGATPDIATAAVVSAHPAAIMLALTTARLLPLGLTRMAATVLQPASEMGSAGVEEMHQQTVALLSFKPLKKELYDAQVAFNLVASLGEAAKIDMNAVTEKVGRHVRAIAGDGAADRLSVQMIQAPVFHGFTASASVKLALGVREEAMRHALQGSPIKMSEEPFLGNESVAGSGDVMLRVVAANSKEGSTFWLWIAADNLRLAARNAAGCALELVGLLPSSSVN